MNYEDAEKEVKQANDEPETESCPLTKESCDKNCKLYKEAYVKPYFFGTMGTSFAPINSSCGLKR